MHIDSELEREELLLVLPNFIFQEVDIIWWTKFSLKIENKIRAIKFMLKNSSNESLLFDLIITMRANNKQSRYFLSLSLSSIQFYLFYHSFFLLFVLIIFLIHENFTHSFHFLNFFSLTQHSTTSHRNIQDNRKY